MGFFWPLNDSQLNFSFLHLSCFAWYWLQIWSILKKNTSFEILRTSAFTWMYSFFLYVKFYVCYEAFYFFFQVSRKYFCTSDNNFKTFITLLIFHQIQHPGTFLNAELNELSEYVIGFKI